MLKTPNPVAKITYYPKHPVFGLVISRVNMLSRGYPPPTWPRNPEPHLGDGTNLRASRAPEQAAAPLLLGHSAHRYSEGCTGQKRKGRVQ